MSAFRLKLLKLSISFESKLQVNFYTILFYLNIHALNNFFSIFLQLSFVYTLRVLLITCYLLIINLILHLKHLYCWRSFFIILTHTHSHSIALITAKHLNASEICEAPCKRTLLIRPDLLPRHLLISFHNLSLTNECFSSLLLPSNCYYFCIQIRIHLHISFINIEASTYRHLHLLELHVECACLPYIYEYVMVCALSVLHMHIGEELNLHICLFRYLFVRVVSGMLTP